MLWVYRKIGMVRSALCSRDTPRQMATGLAFGLLLGLIPNGNLLAVAVAPTLLATRASLSIGMLCAFAVGMIAPLCDPLTHRIGEWILTNGATTPLWRWLERLPLAGWTAFNNTVVMGSLALGMALFYPVYRLSLPWLERLHRNDSDAQEDHVPGDTAAGLTLPVTADTERIVPAAPLPMHNVPYQSSSDRPPRLLPRRTDQGHRRSCA